MLNLSVKEFKDHIQKRIRQINECDKLTGEQKEIKISILEDILSFEFLDDIYNAHNTVWIISQAKGLRREVVDFLEGEDAKANREKYSKLEERKQYLKTSLKAYETMILDLGDEPEEERHDFREGEFEEAKEEIEEELDQIAISQSELDPFFHTVAMCEHISNVLHRLEGIIMNANYFWYLKEA